MLAVLDRNVQTFGHGQHPIVIGNGMSDCPQKRTAAITLYALQNCSHCKDTKKFFQERGIAFKTVYVDMLVGAERNDTMRLLKRINPLVSFPTLKIDDEIIVGFKPKMIQTALQACSNRQERQNKDTELKN